ncbi:MAG: hypothetical protein CMN32_17480 [Saprospirales bacterium]|nr:hypothetical protein [Saprospirales bacterium]
MKNITIALIALITMGGCSPQSSKIISKTINHRYFNIRFSPESISKESLGKLRIEVTPIDAASINRETYEASSRDGNYEKEFALKIEQSKSELKEYSRQERAYIKGKINAIELLNKMEAEYNIPSITSYNLKERIWNGDDFGYDGTEIKYLSENNFYPDYFNPYKINQKYLSVFKVTFENNSNEIQEINLEEFRIITGEELLFPLGLEYFENYLQNEPEKLKNIYRMNMPKELLITPSQRITKYIAVPAINPKSSSLQIQLIKNTDIVNFDFTVKEELLNKSYNLTKYEIYTSGLKDSYSYDFYCAIQYQDGVSIALSSNYIFVSPEREETPVSIYIITVNRIRSNVKFSKMQNVKFSSFENNRIIVPIE